VRSAAKLERIATVVVRTVAMVKKPAANTTAPTLPDGTPGRCPSPSKPNRAGTARTPVLASPKHAPPTLTVHDLKAVDYWRGTMMKLFQCCLLLLGTMVVAQAQQRTATPQQQNKPPVQTAPKSASTSANGDLFVWERPYYPVSNIPITRSATCSFKQGLSVGLQKPPSAKQKTDGANERVSYSISSENESDTVSFTNLDTKTPTIQSNGGQASLVVLHDDGNQLALLNIQSPADGIELYTIFRKQGVVVYSQQKESSFIGPFGVLEMGYCH
jgi:hypothetical protein